MYFVFFSFSSFISFVNIVSIWFWMFRLDENFSIIFRFIFKAKTNDFLKKDLVRFRTTFDTSCEIDFIFWLMFLRSWFELLLRSNCLNCSNFEFDVLRNCSSISRKSKARDLFNCFLFTSKNWVVCDRRRLFEVTWSRFRFDDSWFVITKTQNCNNEFFRENHVLTKRFSLFSMRFQYRKILMIHHC